MLTFFALALLCCSCGYAQETGVTFVTSSTTTVRPTVAPTPSPTGCRCVPIANCRPNFDLRIVNQPGVVNCPTGQTWCCPPNIIGLPPPVATGCGIRKITNSTAQPTGTARYGAYPWQAALLAANNAYIGSGVLISRDFVLTAAHKLSAYPNRNFRVRLGEWDAGSITEPNPYQDFTPAQVTIHPNFNNVNLQNDIALIRLDRNVEVAAAPNINTACLGSAIPAVGTRCWVSGWGKNAFTGAYQTILKEVDVPIVDQPSCEMRLRATRLGQFFVLDRTSFMCAGGELGKDACTGDGGAPLVCQPAANQPFTVVGLVAWGIGCAGSGVPGVYVNVPSYRTWITQVSGIP